MQIHKTGLTAKATAVKALPFVHLRLTVVVACGSRAYVCDAFD